MSSNNENQNNPKIAELIKEFGPEKNFFVLHLDDEEILRNLFKEQLKEFGIQTISAANGEEAIEILKNRSQEIVLIASDIKMPEMDGFRVRSEATSLCPTVPFCIISAHIDRDMALRAVELKIAAFISKPIDNEKLVEVLYNEALPKLRSLKEDRELKLSFIADSEGLIEESEDILLKLEQDPTDIEALNRFYAVMHTLKGASAFFDPKDLHRFTHAYEDILKNLQHGEVKFTPTVTGVLFKGFDVIKQLFEEFRTGKHPVREFESLLKVLDMESALNEQTIDMLKSDTETNTQSKTNTSSATTTKAHGTEDIKVSVKLLDEFIQHSGEVTVIRNMLNKCVGSIERRYAGDRDVGMLTELLAELHKINSGVQNKMTEIRKVPLKSVVRVLPRAVRDVAKSLNKKVNMEIHGDELRVDASIAEVLNNSLLHIIKNSVDHGLETTDERKKAGKSETGNVSVNAFMRDDKVVVKISDDGQGLNVNAIKSKLIKNGTHTKEQVDQMNLPDLYMMIFSSGFSTAQQVTEISGRGVGMSMVKDCVDAIGGKIIIDSKQGQGATFQLELPVPKSVLIASCLGVKIGTRRFSLVQDDILRVIQLDTNNSKNFIQELEKSKCLLFENELIPIANLSELLHLNENLDDQENRKLVVMQTGQDNRRMAIEVSDILDVEDMVIKNMHGTLNSQSFYRGVTFLDDGGVGLILNTNGILDALKISRENAKDRKLKARQHKNEIAGNEISVDQKNALTVMVKDVGIYAIPQESVYRIEEFETSLIKQSGSSQVVPYRGTVLLVGNLKNLISNKFGHSHVETSGERKKMFVVKTENRYVGFHVDEILDMVTYSDLKTDLAQEDHGILGHFFIGDQTIALLDINRLLSKSNNASEFSNNNTSADAEEFNSENTEKAS